MLNFKTMKRIYRDTYRDILYGNNRDNLYRYNPDIKENLYRDL